MTLIKSAICGMALYFVVSFCGCKTREVSTERDAQEIATSEMKRRGWQGSRIDDCKLENGRWFIDISEIPPTAGGYAHMEIAKKNGKIIRFVGGY